MQINITNYHSTLTSNYIFLFHRIGLVSNLRCNIFNTI